MSQQRDSHQRKFDGNESGNGGKRPIEGWNWMWRVERILETRDRSYLYVLHYLRDY